MDTVPSPQIELPEVESQAETTFARMERVVNRADRFVLAFVKCNSPLQQQELSREFVRRLDGRRVLEFTIEQPVVSLLDEIKARLDPANPPDVVCVYGLERAINVQQEYSPVLGRLNNDRDLIRRACPCPLFLWLPDFALDLVARNAPDFWAWRSGVYEFPTDRNLWHEDSAATLLSPSSFLQSLSVGEKVQEITRLQELLRIAQSMPHPDTNDRRVTASLLNQLGILYQSVGNIDNALDCYQASQELLALLHDSSEYSSVLYNVAMVAHLKGKHKEAEAVYHQLLGIAETNGDFEGQFDILHQLGLLEQERGDFDQAEKYYRSALDLVVDTNKVAPARTLSQIATLYFGQRNFQRAKLLFEEALKTAEKVGDKQAQAYVLYSLGAVAQETGDYITAESHYATGLRVGSDIGDAEAIGMILLKQGELGQERTQCHLALKKYLEAVSWLARIKNPVTQIAIRHMAELKAGVGEEQFMDWLRQDLGQKGAQELIGVINNLSKSHVTSE